MNNNIKFIGIVNTDFTTGIHNIKYYGYEVQSPAYVYGPDYHTGKREIPSDTTEMISSTHIKVK